MSYERAFLKLITTAEKAVDLIAVRDVEREHLLSAVAPSSKLSPPVTPNTADEFDHKYPLWRDFLGRRGLKSETDLGRSSSYAATSQKKEESPGSPSSSKS